MAYPTFCPHPDIIPYNYDVFCFSSFSEASTAVVFMANLVYVIMETPIDGFQSRDNTAMLVHKVLANYG